jgi:hypothetical protein
MPEQEERETLERAKEDLHEGKSPSTAAGEFVREEIDHVREGVHGARSPQQAIAIGLSKARRAGIPLKPPAKGKASTKKSAERDYERGQSHWRTKVSPKRAEISPARSRATSEALKRESKRTASHEALSKQTRSASRQRSAGSRRAAAKKAARNRQEVKGDSGRLLRGAARLLRRCFFQNGKREYFRVSPVLFCIEF